MRIDNIGQVNIGNVPELKINQDTADIAEVKVPAQEYVIGNEQKQFDEAVKQANKALEGSGRHFKYEMHEATKHIVVSVVDDQTNKVVKEIPPKKLLDLVAKFMELAGLIVDERR